MTTQVLLLNADWRPLQVIDWKRAMCLYLEDKADLVSEYADKVIHTATDVFPWPAVMVLRQHIQFDTKIRFSRRNIMARDRYTCQYCGVAPRTPSGQPYLESLNVDHVVPRSRSKNNMVVLPWSKKEVPVTSWQNTVCSCIECNSRKAAKTPGEAGMHLRRIPRKPGVWEVVLITLTRTSIPEEWKEFVPDQWKDYWSAELDGS